MVWAVLLLFALTLGVAYYGELLYGMLKRRVDALELALAQCEERERSNKRRSDELYRKANRRWGDHIKSDLHR